MSPEPGGTFLLERGALASLLTALKRRGYLPVGPVVRDGAIVYDRLDSEADLPAGWTDGQEGGRYRLKKRDDAALFGYAVGPHSWKKFLHPPVATLWKAKRTRKGIEVESPAAKPRRYALIGARACELRAIAIQDKVFLGGPFIDPAYQALREGIFVAAVNCTEPGGTCFCVSMETGPRAASGFDLALTELVSADRHAFLVEAGTRRGRDVLREIGGKPAAQEDVEEAHRRLEAAAGRMGRTMDPSGLKELLQANLEHPRWEDVASRCMTCGNCTLVCPTCFCGTVEEETDLRTDRAGRRRRWDSCFTLPFTYIHGGSIRASAKARYRQWLTHKLATWIDQFGTSGCVGCGRCITWCPVGIDLTEEVRAIREGAPAEAWEED